MSRLKMALTAPLLLMLPTFAWASYAIFVRENLTTDGSTFLGDTGDEPSSYWLEIVPRMNHPAGSTGRVGVTKEASFSGELIDSPRVFRIQIYSCADQCHEFGGFLASAAAARK